MIRSPLPPIVTPPAALSRMSSSASFRFAISRRVFSPASLR